MPVASINGQDMYYEIHGEGPPAIYIGGWDTFLSWPTWLFGPGYDRQLPNRHY